nr:nucleotidyltransferase domain-containing protein [Herbihabitans rhizosphaerae]
MCARYGVVELSVFGSTARGDAVDDSDVDLLYVRGPHAAQGLAFLQIQRDLEALIGHRIDLVSKKDLHWVIKNDVLADAEVLYVA